MPLTGKERELVAESHDLAIEHIGNEKLMALGDIELSAYQAERVAIQNKRSHNHDQLEGFKAGAIAAEDVVLASERFGVKP